jgi:hypothetical protein
LRRGGALPLLAAVCAAALASCIDADWTFGVTEDLPAQSLPADTTLPYDSTTLVVDELMDVTQDSEYQEEDFDYVTALAVTGLVLEVSAGSPTPDFGDFRYASVSLQADIDGDGLDEVTEIAYQDDPAAFASSSVEFVTTGADILGYLEAPGGYHILVEVQGADDPYSELAADLDFGGAVTYDVTVGLDKILGCSP